MIFRPAMDIEEVLTSRLRPLLMRVGTYANIMNVVERVFQRAPDIVQEVRDAIEEDDLLRQRTQLVKKSALVDVVCEKVNHLFSCNIEPQRNLFRLNGSAVIWTTPRCMVFPAK